MLISRAVNVKSKVTPSLKARLGAETQKAIRDIDQEMAGSEAGTNPGRQEELARRKEGLLRRLREIAALKDGQEVARGQIQGFFELRVGDFWPHVQGCEILLEDDRVIAIREGKSVSVALPDEPRRAETGLRGT